MDQIPRWVVYVLAGLQVVFGALVATEGIQLPAWAMAIGNAVGALATWIALQVAPAIAPPVQGADQ
jgi:hypothetical protein